MDPPNAGPDKRNRVPASADRARTHRRRGAAAGPTAGPHGADERLKRAMQVDTVGILFFDRTGCLTDCNDAFLRMSGLSRDDVQARRLDLCTIAAPGWTNAATMALHDFRSHGRVVPHEEEYVRPDGTRWWALFAATQLGPDEGVGYVIDVTGRRIAEAARRTTEGEFRAMFELSSVGQFQAALSSGAIVRANQRFCAMVGQPAGAVTGVRLEDLIHPEDRAAMATLLESLLVGRVHESPLAARLMRADGGVVWVEGSVTLMGDDEAGPLRMAAIVRDVSRQRQVEQALSESRERLRLIVDSARDYAILSMDLGRRITTWNAGAEEITGFAASEMLGRSADILFTPDDVMRGDPEREAAVALTSGRSANERWHQRKDGSRFWGSGVLMAMFDEMRRPVGLVKIFRDETEARHWSESLKNSRAQLWEALRENERARDELQAASRAKDHFLAVLSHELRTPLTPVLMAAQSLEMRADLPAYVRPALELIQRNIRIEAHFIDDLLDLTRISRGELEIVREPTDVHSAVESAVEACRRAIEDKDIALEVALDAEEHTVVGDSARLEQVFENVLKNATKFTPGNGRIWLHTDSDAGAFRLTVRDDGIGIEPEHLPGIFDAFSQAGEWVARQYGGLGLGLAIAKASVEAHGGMIRAASAGKNQGTTLTIELPLAS